MTDESAMVAVAGYPHQRAIDTMAVFKSSVDVCDRNRRSIGSGMAYVHLRLAAETEQKATGTVSLRRWEPADDLPTALLLADGRLLRIEVSREVVSECSRNHILRYQAHWPPADAPLENADSPPIP